AIDLGHAQQHAHAIEGHALACALEDRAHDLDTLAALPRRGVELHLVSERTLGSDTRAEQVLLQARERAALGGLLESDVRKALDAVEPRAALLVGGGQRDQQVRRARDERRDE